MHICVSSLGFRLVFCDKYPYIPIAVFHICTINNPNICPLSPQQQNHRTSQNKPVLASYNTLQPHIYDQNPLALLLVRVLLVRGYLILFKLNFSIRTATTYNPYSST